MRLNLVITLLVCAGLAIIAGISRFTPGTPVPRAWSDVAFLLSVGGMLMTSIVIAARAISRHASAEIQDIDERRTP